MNSNWRLATMSAHYAVNGDRATARAIFKFVIHMGQLSEKSTSLFLQSYESRASRAGDPQLYLPHQFASADLCDTAHSSEEYDWRRMK
jgi:hypothetical protein